MAFVNRAVRKLHTNDSSTIGPGAYINPVHYSSTPSFAPFTSTSERNINKIFCNNSTPGPGTYSSINIKNINSSLDHWGNPKFSAPFANQKERFNYSKHSLSPGPGSYAIADKWKIQKKTPSIQTPLNYSRILSAPSIPANHQTFGYDETQNGELVLQKNPSKVYSGYGIDKIGPGHYNINENKKAKGPSWHKNKAKRKFFNEPTTGPEIGPGSYSETKLNIAPMYKFKENAVFLRKGNENDAEIKSADSPGPGSYSIENFGAFNKVVKKRPSSLQNFGSSCVRFQKKIPEYDAGPGHYDDKSFLSKSSVSSKAPFSSTNARFRYKSTYTPGPGAYKDSDLSEGLAKKVWGRNGVFGSSERRFPKKSFTATPGPAHYPPDSSKKVGSNTSMVKKPNAVFLSKSTRNNIIKTAINPAPGSYEIPSKIGALKPPATSMHPALSRVTKTESASNLAFSSKVERFNNNKKQSLPGPGAYDIKMYKRKKQVIVTKEDRFKTPKKPEIPGPGAYCEENQEWNKKSYNVLYSEII